MLTWLVTYRCKPGCRAAFYQALAELNMQAGSRQEPGNLRYDYYFDTQDPDALLLVEQWTEPAAQEAHCQTERFARLQQCKARYCGDTRVEKLLT